MPLACPVIIAAGPNSAMNSENAREAAMKDLEGPDGRRSSRGQLFHCEQLTSSEHAVLDRIQDLRR
jgi:hypothetical protein